MLNEPRQRVTTYPGTRQVVTAPGAMVGHWYALNVLYHMYYNYHRGIMEHSEETPASSKY